MKPGDKLVWRRQLRGGARRFTRIPVTVAGFSPAGNVYVTYVSGGRAFTTCVKPVNLHVPEGVS